MAYELEPPVTSEGLDHFAGELLEMSDLSREDFYNDFLRSQLEDAMGAFPGDDERHVSVLKSLEHVLPLNSALEWRDEDPDTPLTADRVQATGRATSLALVMVMYANALAFNDISALQKRVDELEAAE